MTGEWNDENCQDKNSYICKRPLGNVSPTVPSLPPVTGGCPPGYTSIPICKSTGNAPPPPPPPPPPSAAFLSVSHVAVSPSSSPQYTSMFICEQPSNPNSPDAPAFLSHLADAGMAQLVERATEKPGSLLTLVRVLGAAKYFSPTVDFQTLRVYSCMYL